MIWRSPLVADVQRRAWNRSLRRSAFLLFAFVAAGSLLAAWLLPRPPTPANVVRSYIEASVDRDWTKSWSLICQPRRSLYGDFEAYAKRSADSFHGFDMPKRVEVMAMSVRSDRGPMAVRVAVRDGAGGPWHVLGTVPVVVEDGNVRACPGGPTQED